MKIAADTESHAPIVAGREAVVAELERRDEADDAVADARRAA